MFEYIKYLKRLDEEVVADGKINEILTPRMKSFIKILKENAIADGII